MIRHFDVDANEEFDGFDAAGPTASNSSAQYGVVFDGTKPAWGIQPEGNNDYVNAVTFDGFSI